jgi:hypothetical protein
MGLPNWNDTDWYGFALKQNEIEQQVVNFNHGWSAQGLSKPAALNAKRNSFRFRFQNGKASASVNGKEVLPATEPTRAMRIRPGSFQIGLGAYNDMNNTVIRYQNVQVRRLAAN